MTRRAHLSTLPGASTTERDVRAHALSRLEVGVCAVLVISPVHTMLFTKRLLVVCAVFLGVIACGGCGRRATEVDCAAIIDRNVEVQMRKMNITDPAAISKKQAEIRDQFSESLKGCVGRRITDAMMKCVKEADSVDAIDKCMH